jgi:hypothetical protein
MISGISKLNNWSHGLKTISYNTELVLVEFLNYFSGFGSKTRGEVSRVVKGISVNSNVEIVWQTQALFESGLDLYKARLDKGYGLTDCVSW